MLKRRIKLNELALADNALILEILPKSSESSQYRIIFQCFCGEQSSKQVNDVTGKKSTGLFCYQHSLDRRRRKNILTSIDESAKRDNAKYNKEDITWGKNSRIKFTCFCGIENTKSLCGIKKNQGMFCKKHTYEKTRQKTVETSQLHYATNHPQQSTVIKQNVKDSCMKKYGVEYLSHVPEIHEKQHNYKFKDYTMPSGSIRKIQGYEDKALDELITFHSEDKILTKRFGIKYLYQGIQHYYYPDILLDYDKKKIIEVKSSHTMYYKYHYQKNLAKRNACLTQGYEFEFWIYDKKGIKTVLKIV